MVLHYAQISYSFDLIMRFIDQMMKTNMYVM